MIARHIQAPKHHTRLGQRSSRGIHRMASLTMQTPLHVMVGLLPWLSLGRIVDVYHAFIRAGFLGLSRE